MYHRYLCAVEDVWFQPASEMFWERTRTLLALSATCTVMREVAVAEAWKVYVMCIPSGYKGWAYGVLACQYETVLDNPHLAANVR